MFYFHEYFVTFFGNIFAIINYNVLKCNLFLMYTKTCQLQLQLTETYFIHSFSF